MRKRVLSLFMVIVMALSLAAPAFAAKDDKSDLPEFLCCPKLCKDPPAPPL